MTKKAKRKSEVKSIDPSLIENIVSKVAALEAQLAEKTSQLEAYESKVDLLESKDKKAGMGKNTYGFSEWQPWINGSEKGVYRSCFVDVKSMIQRPSGY